MIYQFLRMKKSVENFKGFLKNLSVNFIFFNSNYIFEKPMTIFIGESNIAEEEEYVSL